MGVKVFKPPITNVILINGKYSHQNRNNNLLLVGRKKRLYQSAIKFDISSLPLFLTLLNCTLKIYLFKDDYPSKEKTVDVHQILSPWHKNSPLHFNPSPSARASFQSNCAFVSFDITPLFLDWYTGNADNSGVLLKLSEVTEPYLLGFSSKNFCNSAFWPFLSVSFLDPITSSERCCQTLDFDTCVKTSSILQTAATLNVQRFNYTYYIINTGNNDATVSMQLSPDGVRWFTDTPAQTIVPDQIVPIVPSVISRYARITYQSSSPSLDTTLNIDVRGF